jgi:hypothetical protein
MAPDELETYQYHTQRKSPPESPARYGQLVVGRRGGKSRILAYIAAYIAAIPDHVDYLVPGETAIVAVLAADRQQAKVILGYIVGFLHEIPLLADIIVDELAETVRLNNRVTIEVHTASIGSPRGRTFLAVLCDEIAFWPTGDSQNPDVEVLNAVNLAYQQSHIPCFSWLRRHMLARACCTQTTVSTLVRTMRRYLYGRVARWR